MRIQPLGASSGSILKLLLFQSFCTSSRKIPFGSLFYIMIFCFISYMYNICSPRARWDNPWAQFFWWKQKGLLTLITGCMFKKIALSSDFMHFFYDFIHVHSPWAGADNPLGPKFWCQQEGLITLVICCKFKKNLFNIWLYTHLSMINNI